MLWKLSLVVGLVAWMLAGHGVKAGTELGPCQLRDGICYHALYQVLTDEEALRLESPPYGPMRFISRRVDPLLDVPPVPVWDQDQQREATESRSRALTLVERPWDDDFYTTIVKVDLRFPNQPAGTIFVCSGTMIGRHTVLTAGHCVYSHDHGGWAEWTHVFPAMADYHTTPFGQSNGASLSSTNWWVNDQNYDGDIGIITLAENTGDLTGWPDIVWDYSSFSGTVHSGGYPADQGYDGYWLYVDSAGLVELADYLICHSAGTVAGMSGGAAWLQNTGSPELTAANSFCYLDWPYTCCAARYVSLTDQQRIDSEAEAAGPPPDHWTCGLSSFAALDGCHCQCGLYDPDCDVAGQPVYGCQPGERCIPPGVCYCDPQCQGRYCGPDGCGSICGTCPAGTVCNDGLCECVPSCAGRECGSDGCTGTCGTCPAGAQCQDGICVCIPVCTGRECGPDGCGGRCGECAAGEYCQDGSCYCLADCTGRQCGPDGCGGTCGSCAPDQECISGQCICTANCAGRECGSDGCGGSCGKCEPGSFCVEGRCQAEGGSDGCGCGSADSRAGIPGLSLLSFLLVLIGMAVSRSRSI